MITFAEASLIVCFYFWVDISNCVQICALNLKDKVMGSNSKLWQWCHPWWNEKKSWKIFFGKSHVALKSTLDKCFKIAQNLLLDLVFAVVCTIDMTARWQQWQQCHCPSTFWRKPVSWRESQKCKPHSNVQHLNNQQYNTFHIYAATYFMVCI